jgi:hypothetical protein
MKMVGRNDTNRDGVSRVQNSLFKPSRARVLGALAMGVSTTIHHFNRSLTRYQGIHTGVQLQVDAGKAQIFQAPGRAFEVQ